MKQSLDKLFDQYESEQRDFANSPQGIAEYEATMERTRVKSEKERLNTPLCDGSSDDDDSIFGE